MNQIESSIIRTVELVLQSAASLCKLEVYILAYPRSNPVDKAIQKFT